MLQFSAFKQLLDAGVDTRSQVGHVTSVVRPPQNHVIKYQTSVQRVAASDNASQLDHHTDRPTPRTVPVEQ